MKIFIAAYPRSGTTLLAKVLVENYGFYSSPESHFLFEMYYALKKNNSTLRSFDLKELLTRNFKFNSWNLQNVNYFDLNINNFHIFYEEILANYNNVSRSDIKKGISLDHTPENLINLEQINSCYDYSVNIRLTRDPRATFASIKKLKWGPNTAYSFQKSWEKYETNWLKHSKHIPEDRVLEIKYEDLILNEELTISKLADFLPRYISSDNKEFKIPSYTKNQHKLIGSNKLDKSRIAAWQDKLSYKEMSILNSNTTLRNFLDIYKYDKTGVENKSTSVGSNLLYLSIDFMLRIRNKMYRKLVEKRP
jgi:hypothetical protein